ncbi:MAG: hypothetical protein CUN49_09560 [Candidatus Thermofonsia Clade 1 bacterium]|jgi:hypothetical protein|uniref:SH3b domain-containing protein n=2 Tax=Candidatus Thermofonsia Clade 1 bacterium TaxID=2364210 RepID=A0A2M8PDK4_9CHLR|nr:MAG: hypothetical protein CUN49_09560 [Candidatus Thermofonsia Clade 1 bacterium]RMF51680.1 MAG: hypothetical protein D6749_07070 [Chloroflexota bacterium]
MLLIAISLFMQAPNERLNVRAQGDASKITRTPLPTNTPRPSRTPTPLPTPTETPTPTPLVARLCIDCNRVRLRGTPGTAGEILTVLDPAAQLTVIGRTADNQWLQVLVSPGVSRGWVSALFVRLPDLSPIPAERIAQLPVQGVAIEASPTPTTAFTASVPPWLTGISSRTRAIYLRGQQLGNRRNVFSKVGDSITAAPHFLYPIGFGQYELGAYGNLANVISFFSQENARAGNSFANQSLAALSGWTADKLLTPGFAYPEICGTDIPLVCEYKHTRPSIALILIGSNDSGSGSPEVFADHLRQIVEISLEMGVIPVLSTIPPKNFDENQEQRVQAWNNVIRAIAAQYEVPLWDYYANMVNLPNRGISSDGLHPSVPPDGAAARFTPENLQYGYTVRNLNALQVLDALLRTVMY